MMFRAASLAGFGLLVMSYFQPGMAHPVSSDAGLNTTPRYDDNLQLFRRADPQDFYLRVMPLGASITAGEYEPADDVGKNGYRKYLRDKLRSEGWKVNMVGNFNRGNMNDNDHEGISGQRVSQVHSRGKSSCAVWLPNVILINAGTNDAAQNGDVESVSGTGLRMKELIEGVLAEVPQAVVVLSTLLPHGGRQGNVDLINEQYRTIYREYVPLNEDGEEEPNPAFKVILAEMTGFITIEDIHDGTHPTVLGEKKMAAVWDWAINRANEKGWLQAPTESGKFSDSEGSTTCRKEFASGAQDPRSGRQVLFARSGNIFDDGTYRHSSRRRDDRQGNFPIGRSGTMWFAQLVNLHNSPQGDERDELIIAPSDSPGRILKMYLNDGNGNFRESFDLDVKDTCANGHIRWGDVNGDGLDDFICLFINGEMYVSLNEGGSPPTFRRLGLYKSPELGKGRDRVRLGDVDGDGRLDYCVMPDTGDVHCWRNGGLGEKASYWQDMGSGGPIFKAKGMGDMRGVQLVDINNDGRYDWLWMSMEGQVTTYINQRGNGKGMIPHWLSAGITHPGRGTDIGEEREHIRFGRVFGGRPSYFHWNIECPVSSATCNLKWQVWENLGEGGKYQKGDGIYWGDVTGQGVDDYLWISPEGMVNVFVNKNTKDDSDYYATTAWGLPHQLDTGLNRRGLHVGDWDGDGKADIIGVTDRNSGALRVWISHWDGTNFNWEMQNVPNSAKCNQGWGRGYFDHGAHFADITGSGRVDYICMAPNGQMWAWLRDESGNWFNAGQIKYTEDLDRANYRFSDIDGNGKADIVHTDKFTGNARVWYYDRQVSESERAGNSGSLIKWDRPQWLFQGAARGPNTYFPNLGGQGRGDMVWAEATSAHAWVSFNSCPAGGDDVDGDVPDPGLPGYDPPPFPTDPPTDPEDHWFCGGNGGTWNLDLWNAHGVGTWLRQRSELYSAIDQSWPSGDGVDGVPRVIAKFDVFQQDNAWNWGAPECTGISQDDCNIMDLTSDRYCPENPERAFALWAMRNYARFLNTWYQAFLDGTTSASLSTAKITTTFLSHAPEDAAASPAAWLTIAAGMFTSIGAFMPKIPGAGVNFVAGLLTTAAGATSFGDESTVEDLRFTDFADLQNALGKMQEWVATALSNYFRQTLMTIPPTGDRDEGTRLARILQSGVFANQDFAIGVNETVDFPTMRRLVQASIISEAWNSGHVGIVKWSSDSYLATGFEFGFNPCFGDQNKHGVDYAVACENGKNYMIARMLSDETDGNEQAHVETLPNVGQDQETLEDFNLNHAKIIASAERTQARANSFRPRGIDGLGPLFEAAINAPGEERVDLLTYFNVPVCDLDQLGELEWGPICPGYWQNPTFTKECMVMLFERNCKKLRLGNSDWPYHL